jgi:hypothetical protein
MSDQNLSIGDKFAAANEQALSEWTDNGEGAVVEAAAEDASEAAEDVEQPESSDESGEEEVEAAEVSSEEVQSEPVFDPTTWDGDMSSLPEQYKALVDPIYKTMERGMHQKFRELASLKKQYEENLAKLQSDPTPKAAHVDAVPPMPTADLPPEVQDRMWQERDAYIAREEVRKQIESMGLKPDPRVQELLMEREVQKVVETVQAYEGWTPEVGQAMAKIAQSHPYYESMLGSVEGMTVLFHTAKTALENAQLKQAGAQGQSVAAKKAEAVVKKQASAASGAVSRSTSTRKAAISTVAKSFEDANKMALEEWESKR